MKSPLGKENGTPAEREPETRPSSESPASESHDPPRRPELVGSESRPERAEIVASEAGEQEADRKAQPHAEEQEAPLFPANELRDLEERWDQIQTGFVDQPRGAVNDAENWLPPP